MKKLYAPWRHAYVTKKDKASAGSKEPLKNNCIFCHKFQDTTRDRENLILKRFKHCAVIMNYYPYNTGHLMVLPLEHQPSLGQLPQAARAEMMEAVSATIGVLERAMDCQGLNVGINLGAAGGGGIPSHLHIHILPRWLGDTNFLATIAETTLLCTDFATTYDQLAAEFAKVAL